MKRRLFIGIDLPESVKSVLDKYADSFIKGLSQFNPPTRNSPIVRSRDLEPYSASADFSSDEAKLKFPRSLGRGSFKKEPQGKHHITLKFLGTTETSSGEILTVLRQKLIDQIAFFVTFAKACVLINTSSTLLVLDVEKNEELLRTYHKLNNELTTLGFPRDKRVFQPHVTLARCKKTLVNVPNLGKIPMHVPIPVSKITLFESKVTRNGSVYTTLGEIQLVHVI